MFNREFQAKRWQHPFIPIASFLLPTLGENEEPSGRGNPTKSIEA